jgi:hypothetical protein
LLTVDKFILCHCSTEQSQKRSGRRDEVLGK